MKFIVRFVHQHVDFRLEELESVAQMLGIRLGMKPSDYSRETPYLLVDLDGWEEARLLAGRCILIKYLHYPRERPQKYTRSTTRGRYIFEYWGEGAHYEQLIQRVQDDAYPRRKSLIHGKSWRFHVEGFGLALSLESQRDRINRFRFMDDTVGKVDLKNPEITYGILEDYGCENAAQDAVPVRIFMGVLAAVSLRADLLSRYDLKQRLYIGTTSMDSELAFLMANQAKASPGKLIMDPFCGTGGILYACSHFGAYTVGGDIDGRQMRGTTKLVTKAKDGVRSNVEEYQLGRWVLDLVVCDITHNPWRSGIQEMLDAIVTDPPYGVRAGARKIGGDVKAGAIDEACDRGKRVPQLVAYEMDHIVCDLLKYACLWLKDGGRLVFWLPVANERLNTNDSWMPAHPQLRLIAACPQKLGKWTRMLITMERHCRQE